ncbi:YheT family hydrolase [Perlucidibaca piscinae]|uniref:YheT family hydrolase n=1 Tax=Perlucidibaca piscinae TaxID=392589 RepID=UPI000403A884|nr:alpha/beta fold hydrolase [Perlucidibaca piscinae]
MSASGQVPAGWVGRGRRPQVICHDSPRNREVVAALPPLQTDFTPTPWLFNAHAQLIFYSLRKISQQRRQRRAALYDHRERLTMRDGGLTALYWCGHDLPADTPTIVVLHTITGSPDSMAELVRDLRRGTGWRVVLCLRRGHADLPLVTPRMNLFGCTDDLREQLAVIRRRFPDSPLYAVGSSAGSGLLVRYLGEEGEAAPFRAGFAYCPGYDTDAGLDVVHPRYSRMMARKLQRQFITPNHTRLAHLSTLPRLQAAEDLASLHRAQFELAGHPDYAAYDRASNPMHVFERIRVPLMVLNAEDDPVCRIGNLTPWLPTMLAMPNVILVTTAEGSHCAHYEGWAARSWSARLMSGYFRVMHTVA